VTTNPAEARSDAALDDLMSSRLGAHLAGLLAAAQMPLTVADLAHLTGRPARRVRSLLTAAPPVTHSAAGFSLGDREAIGRVVRNLHTGRLPPGAEHREAVRALALVPFRAAFGAAAESARTEWGWERAAPFLLGDAYPVTMLRHPRERALLVALLTDPRRRRVLETTDPDAADRQLRAAARGIGGSARSAADLEDLAILLVSTGQGHPLDGTPPRGLPPVYALIGDERRAVLLAQAIRIHPALEESYVAEAAARAGAAGAADLVEAALARSADDPMPRAALIRLAQALAGTALHIAEPADALHVTREALRTVLTAFEQPETPEVASLSQRLFSESRDHERAVAAATLGTAAVALAPAAEPGSAPRGAPEGAIAAARELCSAIAHDGRRAVALAVLACRLRVRGAHGPSGPRLIAEAADAAAAEAIATAGKDVVALARVARLLAAVDPPTAAAPDVPRAVHGGGSADGAAAAEAAIRALTLIADGEGMPQRGVIADAAAALTRTDAALRHTPLFRAASAAVERVAAARHSTALERRTRARSESRVLAEAAVAFALAGHPDEADAAARTALEVCGRIPGPARARPLAEIAAVLLPSPDPALVAAGLEAARAEQEGEESRWDPAAAAVVATAAASCLLTPLAGATAAPEIEGLLDNAVGALRRHQQAPSLTRLADAFARAGRPERARVLADAAMAAANVGDPIRRETARAALARLSEGSIGTSELDVAAAACAWLAEGYPSAGLTEVAATDPAVARRIGARIRADLARWPLSPGESVRRPPGGTRSTPRHRMAGGSASA